MTEHDDDARTRMMPRQSRPDSDRTARIEPRAWSETDEKLPAETADEARAGEPRIEIIPAEPTTGSRPEVPDAGRTETGTERSGGGQATETAAQADSGTHRAGDRADTSGTATSPDPEHDPWYIKLRDRIPERILGGRMRTSTLVLTVIWVGLLVLYGWLNPNGSGTDSTSSQTGDTNVVVPDGYQLTPVPIAPPTTTVPEPTTTTSAPPTTTSGSPETTGPAAGETSATSTAPTTTAGGFSIPGLSIPGLTQNGTDSGQTTPAP
ncbi:hypothetical protein [Millisia brevis]|uniref:hypothetical protein n=1 Tax=Millisia brevis TaxID=264148 RepID=UPI00082ADF25|nr:hypothetical protein [Millisia brevis]